MHWFSLVERCMKIKDVAVDNLMLYMTNLTYLSISFNCDLCLLFGLKKLMFRKYPPKMSTSNCKVACGNVCLQTSNSWLVLLDSFHYLVECNIIIIIIFSVAKTTGNPIQISLTHYKFWLEAEVLILYLSIFLVNIYNFIDMSLYSSQALKKQSYVYVWWNSTRKILMV